MQVVSIRIPNHLTIKCTFWNVIESEIITSPNSFENGTFKVHQKVHFFQKITLPTLR